MKYIRVGMGILIRDENKILLGHKSNKIKDTGGIYEPDTWSLPGGKQEYDETIIEGAKRETKEETNLDVDDLHIFGCDEQIEKDRHFILIYVIADSYKGNLKVMEPDKEDEWRWFDINELPNNIYTPSKMFIDKYIDEIWKENKNLNKH